jgi:hypothetical protein
MPAVEHLHLRRKRRCSFNGLSSCADSSTFATIAQIRV